MEGSGVRDELLPLKHPDRGEEQMKRWADSEGPTVFNCGPLQEIQIYPVGKLLLGNWRNVDLKHVCCNLTVVKHQMKREEASFSGEGATRRGHPEYQEVRHEWRIQTKSLRAGGKCQTVSTGRGHRDMLFPRTGVGRESEREGGLLNRQVMGLFLAQQKLGLFLSEVTSVLVFVVDESKIGFGIYGKSKDDPMR